MICMSASSPGAIHGYADSVQLAAGESPVAQKPSAEETALIRHRARLLALAKRLRNSAIARLPLLQSSLHALARRGLVPRFVWMHLQPIGRVKLRAPTGETFSYLSDSSDEFAHNVCWTDFSAWESETAALVCKIAKHTRVFVDVGAHTGIYTLLVAAVNSRAKVWAFEPNPAVYRRLSRNVAANDLTPRAIIREIALSDRDGHALFFVPPQDASAGGITECDDSRAFEVETARGDALLVGEPVDLIKIDVEGHEALVLAGLARVLEEQRPFIIFEALDDVALANIRETVTPLGYSRCFFISETGLQAAHVNHVRKRGQVNFLLVHDSCEAPA